MQALARRFGGRRGFVRHGLARLSHLVHRPPAIDWARVDRLVFVCKGNICRSAYAGARARAMGLRAVSAGLDAPDGDPANTDAIRFAAGRGLDLAGHRTTGITAQTQFPGDLLLCMEPAQAVRLRVVRPGAQIALLGSFARPPRPYLHDPYGLGADYWQTCLDVIDDALGRIEPLLTPAARI